MKRAATTITAILGGIAILSLALALVSPPLVIARSNNPPTATTGAPDTPNPEDTCIQCHNDFTENDGVGSITAGILPEYTPGQKYTFGIDIARTGSTRWGFEITALTAGGAAAGTFDDPYPIVGLQTAGGRQYIGHTTAKFVDGTYAGTADEAAWIFDWTAPAQGTGTVTFYFAGIAADNDGGNGGDYVYSGSVDMTEGATTDVKATTWGDIKTIYR